MRVLGNRAGSRRSQRPTPAPASRRQRKSRCVSARVLIARVLIARVLFARVLIARVPIAHGGPQRFLTRASPSLMTALRDARGSPPWTPGTTAAQPLVWVAIGRCFRVSVPR